MGLCASCQEFNSYHQRYSSSERQLATVDAGRRNMNDEYIAQKYTLHIGEIMKKARTLNENFETLKKEFTAKQLEVNDVMEIRRDIDSLRREYERFFRDSSWQIDGHVQKRKTIAKKGYFDLEDLKDKIDALCQKKTPNFTEVTGKINKQVRVAEKLYGHFVRTGLKVQPLVHHHTDTEL